MEKNLNEIDDFNEYLDELNINKYVYIIIIAVKDTPGFEIRESTSKKIMKLGTKIDLQIKHWKGYIALINCGKVIEEKISQNRETVNFECTINNLEIKIKSSPFITENTSSINICNKECSPNKRGINIVVIDKIKNIIIDSVCFDTHAPNNPSFRNR